MKKIKFKNLFASLLLAGIFSFNQVLLADDEVSEYFVQIENDEQSAPKVEIKVNGVSHAFSLPQLTEGETKVITTESGESITATKTNNEVSLLVNGKTLSLPNFDGHLGAKLHLAEEIETQLEDNVVINLDNLTTQQKQIIRDAFKSAGIEKEVKFGKHQVIIIEKEISESHSSNGADTEEMVIIKETHKK